MSLNLSEREDQLSFLAFRNWLIANKVEYSAKVAGYMTMTLEYEIGEQD